MLTYEITEDNKILASNIKRCRTKLKESQFDFAENCGISVEILSLIERGIANPKLSTLQSSPHTSAAQLPIYLKSDNGR